MFWRKFPYTNFHDLNLDWFLARFRELEHEWKDYRTLWEAWKTEITNDFNSLKEYVKSILGNLTFEEYINKWLDEHPEATTTVEDHSITRVKLNKSLDDMIFFEPVNVLTLGVKNDGSEDISAIVNEATKEHSLFFPAGIYKVSNELKLEHSIYGVGYNRRFNKDRTFTTFVSDMETTDNTNAIIRIVGTGHPTPLEEYRGIDIKNIDIYANSDESGIIIEPVNYEAIYISEVGIKEIGNAYGIYIQPEVETFISRLLFADNCTIYGRADHPTSVGIFMGLHGSDCRLSNIEIMGVQKGIHAIYGMIYMSNMHIWTGCRALYDHDGWWDNTIALDFSTDAVESVKVIGTNIYLDSSYHFIEVWRGATVQISNLIAWMDGSMAGNTSTDGYLVYTRGDIVQKSVQINGLLADLQGRIKYLMSDIMDVQNARIYTDDNPNSLADIRKYVTTGYTNDKDVFFIDYDHAGKIVELARIFLLDKSYFEFDVNTNTENLTIKLETDPSGNLISITKKFLMGGAPYYYRYDQVNRVLYVYREFVGDTRFIVSLHVNRATETSGLLNYGAIEVFNHREIRDDISGLTLILDEE